jgi:glutaminyl-peptide cyclotransferase
MSTLRRFVVTAALLSACAAGNSAPPTREFDGQQALADVVTQVEFGPRIPGKPGHARAAAWIDSVSRSRADTVVTQRWWHHPARGDSIEMINIMARINPAATVRVLYLAHWDTRPHASNDPTDTLAAVPGANDGGSGVAILLGVMDALRKRPPTIGVDFLFVDGEDFGDFGPPRSDVLIGSEYYARHQIGPRPMFAVLFDMVGGKDLVIPKEQFSQVAAADVVDHIWGIAEAMGYGHIFTLQSQSITDDHLPLIDPGGIRAVDIITDLRHYPAWHTAADTPDKLSAESLEAVGNVAVAVIRSAKK